MNKHQNTLIDHGGRTLKKEDYHIRTSRHVNMNMVGSMYNVKKILSNDIKGRGGRRHNMIG